MVAVLSYLRIGRVNVQAIYSSKHVLGLIGVAIYIYIYEAIEHVPPPPLDFKRFIFFSISLWSYTNYDGNVSLSLGFCAAYSY